MPSTDEYSREISEQTISDSRLWVYKKDSPHHRLLRNNAVVTRGDIIQLVYRTEERHMVILSKDGNGHVTVHYPENEPCNTAVSTRGRHVPLRSSFELDDAPGYEHFFVVTASEPISVERLRAAFDETPDPDLGATPLPGKAHIAAELRLNKR